MTAPRLNREGRPWGVPRCHLNKHGVPKPALSMPDALGKALDYNHDRQLDPARRQRGQVDAYECGWCGAWHVGTRRLRPTILRCELGDRAWWNLQAENAGRPEARVALLAKRGKRQGREAIPSRAA